MWFVFDRFLILVHLAYFVEIDNISSCPLGISIVYPIPGTHSLTLFWHGREAGRQRGRVGVVRVLDLKSGDPEFKSRSDH